MRIRRMEKTETQEQAQSAVPARIAENPRAGRQRSSPSGLLQGVLQNPNLGIQLVIVFLALVSENKQMDHRLETVSSTAEKIGSIAGVLTSTLTSVRDAAEGTKKIRKILE